MRKRPVALAALALCACAVLQRSQADVAAPPSVRPSVFNVRDFGAAGDGKALDTDAINRAISAAGAAGGGTVYFPAGTYAAFSIRLKSNITLHLDQGAVLLAAGAPQAGRGGAQPPPNRPGVGRVPVPGSPAAGPQAFDAAEPNDVGGNYQDFGHSHFHNSLIWGENLHDICIAGPGMIDGNSLSRGSGPANVGVGNKALALKLCRNVTLRDFSFYRGGWFSILATGVDTFTIDNIKIDTNRDGMDIDSCKNVRISNCYVNAPNDDGICLKSDFALGQARACENITISNCQVSGYAVGSLLDGTFDRSTVRAPDRDGPTGRIKFGTESNGGFKNIAISNCVFDHCRGLAFESVDGGPIEDIAVNNLTMRDIFNSPIFIRLGNRARGPANSTPVAQIRRITISNLSASGVNPEYPCLIAGLPDHPIEDVQISNVRIAYRGGGTAQQAAVVPPENPGGYPEPSMFGILPASAFYIRHVRNLEMHHVDATFDKPDARPPFVLSDVAGADFQHVYIPRFAGVPFFTLTKVTDFSTQHVNTIADTARDTVAQEAISK